MADSKASGLTELAASPDDNDLVYVVDISDTSMAATGTSKKNKAKYYLRTNGTANTLGANLAANGYNFTGAGTVTTTVLTATQLGAALNANNFSVTNAGTVGMDSLVVVTQWGNGNGWQSLSFNTGWGDYGAPYQTGQYKRVGDFVFLRGLVKRSSGVATIIATLPSGYRPAAFCHAATTSSNAFAEIDINSSGQIDLAIGSATAWVSLNGIWFSTAI